MAQTDLLKEAASILAGMGQGGDKLLVHITPREAQALKARGGKGDLNPQTGLLEFEADSSGSTHGDGGDGSGGMGGGTGQGGSSTAGGGNQNGGPSGIGGQGGPNGLGNSQGNGDYGGGYGNHATDGTQTNPANYFGSFNPATDAIGVGMPTAGMVGGMYGGGYANPSNWGGGMGPTKNADGGYYGYTGDTRGTPGGPNVEAVKGFDGNNMASPFGTSAGFVQGGSNPMGPSHGAPSYDAAGNPQAPDSSNYGAWNGNGGQVNSSGYYSTDAQKQQDQLQDQLQDAPPAPVAPPVVHRAPIVAPATVARPAATLTAPVTPVTNVGPVAPPASVNPVAATVAAAPIDEDQKKQDEAPPASTISHLDSYDAPPADVAPDVHALAHAAPTPTETGPELAGNVGSVNPDVDSETPVNTPTNNLQGAALTRGNLGDSFDTGGIKGVSDTSSGWSSGSGGLAVGGGDQSTAAPAPDTMSHDPGITPGGYPGGTSVMSHDPGQEAPSGQQTSNMNSGDYGQSAASVSASSPTSEWGGSAMPAPSFTPMGDVPHNDEPTWGSQPAPTIDGSSLAVGAGPVQGPPTVQQQIMNSDTVNALKSAAAAGVSQPATPTTTPIRDFLGGLFSGLNPISPADAAEAPNALQGAAIVNKQGVFDRSKIGYDPTQVGGQYTGVTVPGGGLTNYSSSGMVNIDNAQTQDPAMAAADAEAASHPSMQTKIRDAGAPTGLPGEGMGANLGDAVSKSLASPQEQAARAAISSMSADDLSKSLRESLPDMSPETQRAYDAPIASKTIGSMGLDPSVQNNAPVSLPNGIDTMSHDPGVSPYGGLTSFDKAAVADPQGFEAKVKASLGSEVGPEAAGNIQSTSPQYSDPYNLDNRPASQLTAQPAFTPDQSVPTPVSRPENIDANGNFLSRAQVLANQMNGPQEQTPAGFSATKQAQEYANSQIGPQVPTSVRQALINYERTDQPGVMGPGLGPTLNNLQAAAQIESRLGTMSGTLTDPNATYSGPMQIGDAPGYGLTKAQTIDPSHALAAYAEKYNNGMSAPQNYASWNIGPGGMAQVFGGGPLSSQTISNLNNQPAIVGPGDPINTRTQPSSVAGMYNRAYSNALQRDAAFRGSGQLY